MFSKTQKFILVVLALSASFVWYAITARSPETLRVSALNVGQGDAIFFETPAGAQVLIDGGPGRAVLAELGRVMPAYDRSIDVVIATHTDFDHLAGLVEVLKNYDVGMVIENGATSSTGIYAEFEKLLTERAVAKRTARAGDRMVFDRDIALDFYGPFPEDFEEALAKSNEAMIVARLHDSASSFLFTGDIERGDELRLAGSGVDLASDVLKVAHHGSKNSSTDLFLAKVKARYAVISVGASNRYGHPAPEVLERVTRTRARIFRTDRDGRVIFVSDGRVLRVE